jgi:hypothetical protein
MDVSTLKIANEVVNKAEIIARGLKKGDVELRKTANGVSVTEITKKVVAR